MNRTITATHKCEVTVIANKARIVLDMEDEAGDGFTLLVRPDGSMQFVPWIDHKPASIADLFKQLENVSASVPSSAG